MWLNHKHYGKGNIIVTKKTNADDKVNGALSKTLHRANQRISDFFSVPGGKTYRPLGH